MLIIYFGFILLVAYAPKFLGMRLGTGVTTIGIPIGLFVIVSAFVLTGIYVSKANSKYDALIRELSRGTSHEKALLPVGDSIVCQPAHRSRLRPAPSMAAPSRRSTGSPSACSSPLSP